MNQSNRIAKDGDTRPTWGVGCMPLLDLRPPGPGAPLWKQRGRPRPRDHLHFLSGDLPSAKRAASFLSLNMASTEGRLFDPSR
jgi:hypothetical protein